MGFGNGQWAFRNPEQPAWVTIATGHTVRYWIVYDFDMKHKVENTKVMGHRT